jgi:hypothetical protein
VHNKYPNTQKVDKVLSQDLHLQENEDPKLMLYNHLQLVQKNSVNGIELQKDLCLKRNHLVMRVFEEGI